MAENVHAVVSNRHHQQQQQQQQQVGKEPQSLASTSNYNNNNNNNNNIVHAAQPLLMAEDDDDDDIDIIGRSTDISETANFHLPPYLQSANNSSNNLNTAIFINNNNNAANFVNYNSGKTSQQPKDLTPEFLFINNAQTAQLLQKILSQNQANLSQNNESNNVDADNDLDRGQKGGPQQSQQIQEQSEDADSEWMTPNVTYQQSRDRLRRKLCYHFMSPIDKWKIRGRFPWKMLFQIVKIVLVTTQVILFGNSFTAQREVDNSMILTLHDLFLMQWDSSRDFKTIPPDVGPYAVYTKDDIYQHIDYAIKNYANITELAFGTFGYQLGKNQSQPQQQQQQQFNIDYPPQMSAIKACFQRYSNVTLNPSYAKYYVDLTIIEKCLIIDQLYPPGSKQWRDFSFQEYLLQNHPKQTDFASFLHLSLLFPLRAVLLDTFYAYNGPQCWDIDLVLNFNNRPHSGEITITTVLNKSPIECDGNSKSMNHVKHIASLTILINIFVLILSIMSMALCIRTMLKAQRLRQETASLFNVIYQRRLETKSSLHFIDGWILMIMANDCLLIMGTIINLLRKFNMIGPHRINSIHPAQLDSLCSAFLGVGLLLVWFGILRYLSFFEQYNILLVTLKHSAGRVARFVLCAMILYGGFCFSGWIILGPYHYKFYTLAMTSECLFALMNGDDVFATFAYLKPASPFVWWFSRIYLYCYVFFFIYVVLSVFIAILMDSYETIKEYYAYKKCKNQKKMMIPVGFNWANDQLARFMMAKFPQSSSNNADDDNDDDDDSDTLSNFRSNLLNDDRQEYEQSQNIINHHSSFNYSRILNIFPNFWRWIQYRTGNSSNPQSADGDTVVADNDNQPLYPEAIN